MLRDIYKQVSSKYQATSRSPAYIQQHQCIEEGPCLSMQQAGVCLISLLRLLSCSYATRMAWEQLAL